MTAAAQTLAALLLPLIAIDADSAEIGEAITDIYTAEIGGRAVAFLADALSVALDGGKIEEDERDALEAVGLLAADDLGTYLPGYRAAARRLGWA